MAEFQEASMLNDQESKAPLVDVDDLIFDLGKSRVEKIGWNKMETKYKQAVEELRSALAKKEEQVASMGKSVKDERELKQDSNRRLNEIIASLKNDKAELEKNVQALAAEVEEKEAEIKTLKAKKSTRSSKSKAIKK